MPVGDQALDRLPQVEAAAGVQPGRRLVEEQHRRLAPRARRRGPAGGACRPSRSWRAGRPASTRSKRSSSSCAARACAAGARLAVEPARPWSRFSRPVRFSSTAAYWPARPICWRSSAASRTTSRPATRAVPASGFSSVVSTRTAVVLPAPLGPSRPSTVPAARLEVDAVERAHVAEGLHEPLDGDRGAGGGRHALDGTRHRGRRRRLRGGVRMRSGRTRAAELIGAARAARHMLARWTSPRP